jgi:uncharacterized protein
MQAAVAYNGGSAGRRPFVRVGRDMWQGRRRDRGEAVILIVLLLLLLALVYGPQLWVRHVMRRHAHPVPGLQGTGGELARHLVSRFGLDGVTVEETAPFGDHYDPTSRTVRLSPDNFGGRSLTAIAVAAHEVGHALQFHRQERVSRLRLRYMPAAIGLKKLGVGLLMLMPVILLVLRVPHAVLALAAVAIAVQLVSILMYAIVLPEEWDASFNKALPILIEGRYIHSHQVDSVRQVLKAAALTYVAGALADMLNLARWFAILRR